MLLSDCTQIVYIYLKGDQMYLSSSLIVIGIIGVLLVVRLVEGDVML